MGWTNGGWERSDFIRGLDGADLDIDLVEEVADEYLRHFDMNAAHATQSSHKSIPQCAFRGAEFLYSRPWAGIVPTDEPRYRKGLGTVGDVERPHIDPELLVCRSLKDFLAELREEFETKDPRVPIRAIDRHLVLVDPLEFPEAYSDALRDCHGF